MAALPAVTAPAADTAFAAGAHLGLRDWISPSGAGSIAFADVRGYRVTAGVPRSSPEKVSALLAEFGAACREAGRKPLHFGMPAPTLEFLETDRARARWHVGDLPVFDLGRWREDSGLPAGIRAQARRARNHRVTVRHWSAPPPSEAMAPLRAALGGWLREKSIPPLRFMTTPFLFDPWPREGVFTAERVVNGERRIEGVLVASRALFGDVFRVDAVVRAPGAPNGCAELLVREAFRRAGSLGLERATLGLAPLARRSGARTRGWPNRLSRLARRLGSPLYSFAGLEAFKAKFAPDAWVPVYCVAPGSRFAPGDVLAVARAFAGGSLRRYAAQAFRWRLRRPGINYFRA